jgi:Rps23 Pro-64 3,4-dihydroxylase Tpa1-like proline 4-hydroxylase
VPPAFAQLPALRQPFDAHAFRLNPNHDVAALARDYAANGRVRVDRFLADDGLPEFYDDLEARDDWWHLMSTAGGVLELDRETRDAMSPERRAELDAEVQAVSRKRFGYRYEGLRVPSEDERPAGDPLTAFAELMQSAAMLDFLRAVTGASELAFTDGQATAYGPGDFLSRHDDNVIGKNRLAAYVFGLTPNWRAEYGGVLIFHDAGGHLVTGHVPQFNTLDLFAVPQLHSVSMVTPAAPGRRYAVTGWLRAGTR